MSKLQKLDKWELLFIETLNQSVLDYENGEVGKLEKSYDALDEKIPEVHAVRITPI